MLKVQSKLLQVQLKLRMLPLIDLLKPLRS